MVNTVSVAQTYDQDIDGLLTGVMWESSDLTYSFPTKASYYGSNYGLGEPQNNFKPLAGNQIAAVRTALDMYAAVADLHFTPMQETAGSHAVLRLAMSDAPGSAWTYTPADYQEAGDTWFGIANGWYQAPQRGNYDFYTVVHELGHALGLKHGNEAGVFGAMTPAHDSMEYSVMTYRSYVGATGEHVENEAWGYAQTPMMDDIAAVQHMYGANFATNSGDTVYRWDPSTGQSFVNGQGQEKPGDDRVFMTVWDGGGSDTYDLSNYASSLTLDLRPGAWSVTSDVQRALLGSGHPARGNIANALLYEGDPRSLIENATGGVGSDSITGNQAANVLKGGAGNDRLSGLDGNDRLIGGSGNDVLTSGTGADSFVFDTAPNVKTNLDRLADFNTASDAIDLDHTVFTKLGKTGVLDKAAFWAGPHAHDSSDRILYDSKSGALYYDADGTGHAAQVEIALLTKNLKMSAGDFFIV